MRTFSLGEIAGIVGGTLIGDGNFKLNKIFIDSRKSALDVDDSVFIALTGQRNDGHSYMADLYASGFRAFIVQEGFNTKPFEGANFVLVKNTLRSLQKISAIIRTEFKGRLLGITGSNGKTIVKEWIYQILREKAKIVRSPDSYNSQVGVPLSLFLVDNHYDIAIIEAGISEPGEMDKLEEMIRPDIGIITNISGAHQENFLTLQEKAEEKLKLFKNSKTIVYCKDYPEIHELLIKHPSAKLISWGRSGKPNYLVTSESFSDHTEIHLNGGSDGNFKIPFIDTASIENAVNVFVLLRSLSYDPEFIAEGMAKLEPVAMRMEILKGINNCTIINDAYNSDLVSLFNAIHFLNQQDQSTSKTLILSDILQSGIAPKELYSEVAEILNRNGINRLIGIGDNINNHASVFSVPDSYFYKDTDEFLKKFDFSIFTNEAILLKGSRKYSFELISAVLQEKAHRTVMEIDLNALVDNYRFYKSILQPETKIMAMVKAFSYGSGSYEIANILQYHKADYLAVAFADEGVLLRKNGIRLPVMVMNPAKDDFPLLTGFNLEPEIYNFRILNEFNNYLFRKGISNYPVHIKIDTGMHRLGFNLNEIESLCELLKKSAFKVVSIFSHLAAADDPLFDEFTNRQISVFERAADEIRKKTGFAFLKHILNSAGVERFSNAQFDMVRLGIGLYGLSSFSEKYLQEVSTFSTKIAQIMELDESETVGYGRKGVLKHKSRIATIPVGYADGLPRSLGNGNASFLLNEHAVPTVGNICMDMCMVDVTDTSAGEGDRVEIFGKAISIKRIAEAANTIPYEILTSISARVKRIYYRE